MSTATGSGTRRSFDGLRLLASAAAIAAVLIVPGMAQSARAATELCDGVLQAKVQGFGDQPDLVVNKKCEVMGPGPFHFGRVNIVAGGALVFIEPAAEPSTVTGQDFWATAIIIENGGKLLAGVKDPAAGVDEKAYGKNGKTLTIHLYGKDRREHPTDDEGPGESCVPIPDEQKAAVADCGIPRTTWESNGKDQVALPGGVPKDFFYQYSNLHGDIGTDPVTKQQGHFGYKVLAVSYGGTLRLRGKKGTTGTPDADIATMLNSTDATQAADDPIITDPGTDWTRLGGYNDGKALTLDMGASRTRTVLDDWKPDDEVVVTSTDYLPSHSELRQIKSVDGAATITLNNKLAFPHDDKAYDVAAKVTTEPTAFRAAVEKADGGSDAFLKTAETRAAVALLTRSIRIVSAGDTDGDAFPAAETHYMYGGHVVFRQGFEKLQLQGVEFKQLGQGGLLGRYPVHFHIARRVPADTYVIDSSINESMTRWIVIHSTLGVTVARNVGWESIGHGFFLEDATETDNKFYSNIGIYARGSVLDADNPRQIPGLLDAKNDQFALPLKYHSDAQYPSVFWITNGWNAFAGNMAAGAGTCGACYWFVPSGNHDMMEVTGDSTNTMKMTPMSWSGYSAIQADPKGPGYAGRAGRSPIQLFYKNYCSTAMHSLSVTDGSPCTQVMTGQIQPVADERAPDATRDPETEPNASRAYYPRYAGLRLPTKCNPDAPAADDDSCTKADCVFADPKDCEPSVFSHYTSSFNWAESNFSAIWLRSSYLLLDHAFLSDIQGPGVTIVTGGDYSRANLPVGYWGLTTNSIFVGETQPDNPFAHAKGPQTTCMYKGNVCLDQTSGVAYPLSNWGAGQRLYNVYDGPAYEDANAFLDIHPSSCNSLADCMYYNTLGVRKAGGDVPKVPVGEGYLANAAIAWKQSNGFYYPPAFHSRNLYFGDVDIRHYVIEPITYPGTYRTYVDAVQKEYANVVGNTTVFDNWSDVDRQTELSDDDGSLTGFNRTISVNEDPFFAAPVQTAECRSAAGVDAGNACAGQATPNTPTARTSPYDHITTVLYPDPAQIDESWTRECSTPNCTGVPIYRQYLTGVKDGAAPTREWARWTENGCDAQLEALRGKTRQVPMTDPYTPPPANPPAADPFQKFAAQCPSPFVRLAGMNLYQRSALTVNNGRYFIDTTVSRSAQEKTFDLPPLPPPPPGAPGMTRGVSVFRTGKTYYVFLLFAKPGTKQTYQIYVGPNFDGATDVKGVTVDITTLPLAPDKIKTIDAPFLTVTRDSGPGANEGVVNVNLDFTKLDPALFDPRHLKDDVSYMDETCQPHTYCTKVGSPATCGCDEKKLGVLGLLNPNYKNVCNEICTHWAVADLDCPKGGCYGFKFTMPVGFEAKDQMERPLPVTYPSDPWGKIQFVGTSTVPDNASNQGGCHYAPNTQTPSNLPDSSCKVAN